MISSACIHLTTGHYYSPMHKHPSASVKAILNELVASREVLKQILIVNVIDLDDLVLEVPEQLLVQRQSKD